MFSKITSLITQLSNLQVGLIQESAQKDMDSRIKAVKSNDWKIIYSRMELDEAWAAGFNTACIMLGVGEGFCNSDGSLDATTEYEIRQQLK